MKQKISFTAGQALDPLLAFLSRISPAGLLAWGRKLMWPAFLPGRAGVDVACSNGLFSYLRDKDTAMSLWQCDLHAQAALICAMIASAAFDKIRMNSLSRG